MSQNEQQENQGIPPPGDDDPSTTPVADPSGYYALLGVSNRASPQDIRRAFLSLSQRYHTDKHVGQSAEMQEAMNDRFQQLQQAYTVLSDERQRAAYDAVGVRGVECLELVPSSLHDRKDIISYICSLDREAQLIKTAKMLSATSDITATFSLAHLFLPASFIAARHDGATVGSVTGVEVEEPPAAGGETKTGETSDVAPHTSVSSSSSSADAPSQVPGHGGDAAQRHSAASTSSPSAASTTSSAQNAAPTSGTKTASTPPQPTATTPTPTGNAAGASSGPASMSAQMMVKEVNVDGRPTLVLIPSDAMQAQLRQRMAQAAGTPAPPRTGASSPSTSSADDDGAAASAAGSSSSSFGERILTAGESLNRPSRRFGGLTPVQAFGSAPVPKSLVMRHTFQHSVSPRVGIIFVTDARSTIRSSSVSWMTAVEHTKSPVCSYAYRLRASAEELKLTIFRQRILNPLWTLQTSIVCFKRFTLLQKLELTLIRKLSNVAKLENTLAMSLTENGYWKTTIDHTEDKGSMGCSTYIGFQSMTVTAFTVMPIVFGTDTKDPKNPPVRGAVQYSINSAPFTGQTHVGFEAWYHHDVRQKYGVAFTTVIPYSISPIAPPFFLVKSSQFAVINQISLLYARGNHNIRIPIIVFMSPRISQGMMWLSVPMCLFRLGSVLYRPYAKAKAERYYAQVRKEHIAEVDIARAKAIVEQKALEVIVMASRASEDAKGGLVIINARYGVLKPQFTATTPPSSPTSKRYYHQRPVLTQLLVDGANAFYAFMTSEWRGWRTRGTATRGSEPASPSFETAKPEAATEGGDGVPTGVVEAPGSFADAHDPVGSDPIPLSIDVTIALQNLVRESALVLPEGTKSVLVGFCDPDPYTPERKQLKVAYWFRKKRHVVIIDDDMPLELPQREHLVE